MQAPCDMGKAFGHKGCRGIKGPCQTFCLATGFLLTL